MGYKNLSTDRVWFPLPEDCEYKEMEYTDLPFTTVDNRNYEASPGRNILLSTAEDIPERAQFEEWLERDIVESAVKKIINTNSVAATQEDRNSIFVRTAHSLANVPRGRINIRGLLVVF